MASIIEATFETVRLKDLQTMRADVRDELPFGVVGLDASGITKIYNETEARMAGLDAKTVIGCDFFNAIAQCNRSAISFASDRPVAGNSTANSSPPRRASTSVGRIALATVCANRRRTRSPVRCP